MESEYDGAGFYDIDSGFVSIYDPVLGEYALTAPFSDTAYFMQSFAADDGTTELTTLRELSITGGGEFATFTASAGTATPEPSSFLLLGAGLLAVIAAARRQFGRTAGKS